MNKRTLRLLAGCWLVLALLAARPVYADGIVIVDPPLPDIPPYLAVKYHHVQVTIDDQVATTHVDQVFVNESRQQVEGTYTFPLPEGATIQDFAMWVDGKRLEGEILPAEEARRIYEDIVRRQRDPALLEYIDRSIFRARIFPILPGEEKRVEIEYSQVLPLDNGLVHYIYPLDTERFSPQPIGDVSIRVEIHSRQALKALYSPSHEVDIDRQDDYQAVVGYEAHEVLPDTDFELYYAISSEDIGLNLLSYAPADEDGFFLLLLAPQVEAQQQEIVARDVFLVLDTSGSMTGEKLDQAKDALAFVLDHLHEEDRFNVVSFSTGVHHLAPGPLAVSERARAMRWVDELEAKGGTNIHRALIETLAQVAPERPSIVIFLTDGLATEGVVETEQILADVDQAAAEHVRIFPFGVGDDVNTILLDLLAREYRGASAYVRPGQRIDEQVAAFYAKISMPLLSDLRLDMGSIHVEDTYPYPLPDLFAGTQIVMAGRYRAGGSTTVVLEGTVNGEPQTFTFEDVTFRQEGGEPFIPRLWATRKVGYLLNEIRLHGQSEELVQEIVDLAVRYGIVTPYTSFLVNEDVPVFSDEGRRETAEHEYSVMATATPAAPSGAAAVDKAQSQTALERSGTANDATGGVVKVVGDKTFLLREGVWIDTTFDADHMVPLKVGFMSDEYFALLAARPAWGVYLAVGERVLVVLEGQAYQVVAAEEGEPIPLPALQTTPTATPADDSATITPRLQTPSPNLTRPVEPGAANPGLCGGAAAGLVVTLLAAAWLARRD